MDIAGCQTNVWVVQELHDTVDELWLAFGTGKNFRYIGAHELVAYLGPERSKSLPILHAITGCDTTSTFAGRGKKTAWAVWNTFPEVTDAFLHLASAPRVISSQAMSTIERFVVLLYDRTSTCSNINLARKKLFSKKGRSLEGLPPTQAALEQHVRGLLTRLVIVGGRPLCHSAIYHHHVIGDG